MRVRHQRSFAWALLAAGLLGPGVCSLRAQEAVGDWPLFRGNAQQTGVAASSLPEQLAVRWTIKIEDGVDSTAAIATGAVYIGSELGDLYALDLATGQKKWQQKLGQLRGAPSVYRGAVYVGDLAGKFHCLDAATGQPRWTFQAADKIISGANFVGEQVVFGCYDKNLYCLSLDGKLLWEFKTRAAVNATPVVAGDRILVAGCDQYLRVLDAVKGEELAVTDLGAQAGATPAVVGAQAYVGTMGNQVLAIDWKKGVVLWRFQAKRGAQAFYASPAVAGNLVVVGSRDKLVRALNRQSGKEVWAFATRGRVDSSPVIVGQRVFAASQDGNLYVLDLASGKEVTRIEISLTGCSPAVGGNSLVLGSARGTVYCIGAKK